MEALPSHASQLARPATTPSRRLWVPLPLQGPPSRPTRQAQTSFPTCGSGALAGTRERSTAAFTTSAVASRCAGASSALRGDCAG